MYIYFYKCIVHFVTNWQVFFCYSVTQKEKSIWTTKGFRTIFNNLCCSVLHDDKEHIGVGAVTSPHPASVYNSTALIITLLWASLWAKWYFLFCFIFPNILHSDIQYFFGPSGAPWASFFKKYVYAVLLTPFLGCHFFLSLGPSHTLNESNSFSHSGKKLGFGARCALTLIPMPILSGLMSYSGQLLLPKIHLDHFKDA